MTGAPTSLRPSIGRGGGAGCRIRHFNTRNTARDMEAIRSAMAACFDSADYREGRRAFMEKRKPAFTGG